MKDSPMGDESPTLTRRTMFGGLGLACATAGAIAIGDNATAGAAGDAAGMHPGFDPAIPGPGAKTAADFPVSATTHQLSSFISTARERAIPPEVSEKAKWHILDTLAAIVAGSQLPTGRASKAFARDFGGKSVATVIGYVAKCDPMTAALLNGTMGHGHETDDTGGSGGPWHPGINVVPAALALGEQFGISGQHFLRAIVVGYDVGGRVGNAAGLLRNFKTPTVSVCGYFGAAAAAACAAGLSEEQVRYALSYTAQQSSGIDSFRRDPDHIEKGFMNGGMGARGGVTSALLVKAGFTGVRDIFTGPASFFALFRAAGLQVQPDALVGELGSRYDVMGASFKRRPVAGAISAVLDSLEALMERQPINPAKIRDIVIRYEPNSVTDNAGPIDVNMQHAVAMTLVDKRVTFRSVHQLSRFADPELIRLRSIIRISPIVIYVQTGKFIDPSAAGSAARLGSNVPVIQITLDDGTKLIQGDVPARGEGSAPFTRDWIVDKAMGLMSPSLGKSVARQIVETVLDVEKQPDLTRLVSLMQVTTSDTESSLPDWPKGTV